MTTLPPPACLACARLAAANRDLAAERDALDAQVLSLTADNARLRADCAAHGTGRLIARGATVPPPHAAQFHPPTDDGPAAMPSNWRPPVASASPAALRPASPRADKGLRLRQILDLLTAHPDGRTVAQIKESIGISSNHIHEIMTRLKTAGQVVSIRKHTLGLGRQALYRLAPPVPPC